MSPRSNARGLPVRPTAPAPILSDCAPMHPGVLAALERLNARPAAVPAPSLYESLTPAERTAPRTGATGRPFVPLPSRRGARALAAAAPAPAPETARTRCEVCGLPIPYPGRGMPRRRCDMHRRAPVRPAEG